MGLMSLAVSTVLDGAELPADYLYEQAVASDKLTVRPPFGYGNPYGVKLDTQALSSDGSYMQFSGSEAHAVHWYMQAIPPGVVADADAFSFAISGWYSRGSSDNDMHWGISDGTLNVCGTKGDTGNDPNSFWLRYHRWAANAPGLLVDDTSPDTHSASSPSTVSYTLTYTYPAGSGTGTLKVDGTPGTFSFSSIRRLSWSAGVYGFSAGNDANEVYNIEQVAMSHIGVVKTSEFSQLVASD